MNGEATKLAQDISGLAGKLKERNPPTDKMQGGNPNSCRPCGRDIMYAVGRINAMWDAADTAEKHKDISEALNLKDWAEKIDRILVSAYKTCNLQDFPGMRFRIGELKKEVIKGDWPAVKSRLLDIKMRLGAAFETPE